MGVIQKQPSLYTSNDTGFKAKYVEALRVHVVEPMRRDLLEMQAQLRAETSSLDLDGEIERALRVLDAEFERARNMRLSDHDVAAPVIGQAAGIAAR